MVLDEGVIWQQDLPEALHRYTARNQCSPAGPITPCSAGRRINCLLQEPSRSQWKYNITAPQARMEAMVGGLVPVAVLLLAVVPVPLWFSWRGARHLHSLRAASCPPPAFS